MTSGNPNFPISTAVVNWFDKSGGLHIRVYSSDGYTVTERCSDAGGPGWQTGQFNQPGVNVSATVWTASDGAHIRVYCTINDVTTEWCSDPGTGWTKGSYTTR
ncbi:hypothetical protein ACLB0R_11005 [Sphingomonas sp. GlSt437]|uniref:hypothetical protein n=1 Tax=Sphingomonas sp. GlSt437 TaxID=3389970 RepID=UPI003A84D189